MNYDYYVILFISLSYFLVNLNFRIFTQYLFSFSVILGLIKFTKSKNNILIVLISYYLGYYIFLKNNPFIYYFSLYLPLRRLFRCIIYYSFISYILESKEKKEEHYVKKIFLYFKSHYLQFFIINLILFLLKLFETYFNNHLFIYFYPKSYFIDLEEKYYICANIYNNEEILPNWIYQLKKLIYYLGTQNVYISIFENGDSNDKSAIYLNEFREYLNNLKIPNKIITTHIVKKKGRWRMDFLAEIRNKALEYIYEIPNLNFNKTRILFFNDIIYNYEDVIRLIGTNKLDYDVACPLDFDERGKFYDTWVSIDLNGMHFMIEYPMSYDFILSDLIINEEVSRVFSCWNGMVSMKAYPFINKNITFRIGDRVVSSECTLMNTDLYLNGYQKILINPKIWVSYSYKKYYWAKYIAPLYIHFKFYRKLYFKRMNMSNYLHEDLKSKYYNLSPGLKKKFETHLLKKGEKI